MSHSVDLRNAFATRIADPSDPGACWIWTGCRTRAYGVLQFRGQKYRAHRLAWELANGTKIPDGLMACHSCDVPLCVNPAHIWVGTAYDNNKDSSAKGRRVVSHCPSGHEYTTENTTYRMSHGQRHRRCLTCYRAKQTASQRKYEVKRLLRQKEERRLARLSAPKGGGV